MASSDKRIPTDEIGIAFSQSPEWGAAAALSLIIIIVIIIIIIIIIFFIIIIFILFFTLGSIDPDG